MRLDVFLFENQLATSRSHAANLIALRQVTVNDKVVLKASSDIKESDVVRVAENAFARLGEVKIDGAFTAFSLQLNGKTALDVGCSNGGFSRKLLDAGVKKLFALDVGECCLAQDILANTRVIGMFNTNIRAVDRTAFDSAIDFVTIDVSFISLKLVLPAVKSLLLPGAQILALIKPQFELNKNSLTKKGLVKNAKLQISAVEDIKALAVLLGMKVLGVVEAPHPFPDKNQEYFLFLQIE